MKTPIIIFLRLVFSIFLLFYLGSNCFCQTKKLKESQKCQNIWKYKPLKKTIKLKVYLSVGKGGIEGTNLVLGVTENNDTIAAVDIQHWGAIRNGDWIILEPSRWSKEEKKYRPVFVLNPRYPDYEKLYCIIKTAYQCRFIVEEEEAKEFQTGIRACMPPNKQFNKGDSIIYQVLGDFYSIKIKTSLDDTLLDYKFDCKNPKKSVPTYFWSNEKILCLVSAVPVRREPGPFCSTQTFIKLKKGYKKLIRENVVATDEENNLIAYGVRKENNVYLIIENLITEEKQEYPLGEIPCSFINSCLHKIQFEDGKLKGEQIIKKDVFIEIEVQNKK